MSVDVFLTFFSLFCVAYGWEKVIVMKHIVHADCRRMKLYRLRDKLHDLVLSGRVSHKSNDYIVTADFLHKIIDIHQEADFLFFCELITRTIKGMKSDHQVSFTIELHEVLQIWVEAVSILLDAIEDNSLTVKFLLWRGKLRNAKSPWKRWRPVQTYESLDSFNGILGNAA